MSYLPARQLPSASPLLLRGIRYALPLSLALWLLMGLTIYAYSSASIS